MCVCLGGIDDVIMMGFHAATGLVSVFLQVIVDSIVLFCYLLLCSAMQTYMYRRREYSNSEELNPVQVAFCNSGTIRLLYKATPQGNSCLRINDDVLTCSPPLH